MSKLRRSIRDAAIAVAVSYVVILLLIMFVQRALPSLGALVLATVPALMGPAFAAGLRVLVSCSSSLHLGAGRSPWQVADPYRPLADPETFGPAVNVNGTPMVNGVDINGNSFGVTTND